VRKKIKGRLDLRTICSGDKIPNWTSMTFQADVLETYTCSTKCHQTLYEESFTGIPFKLRFEVRGDGNETRQD